ncbi:MAG TPA: YeeE/YedE thiosulfate transporter family protein [Methanomicrobiales archaeon]|jgi:uncharacterized membrane protein YedE/YeeE|nr:YeeE/YedE thiosulfate transporter family protein [Methanomicrobiales archaeon]
MATGWLPKETAVIAIPVVTLAAGALIGWFTQRSGFCSVGGIRDLILLRQTRLLTGFLALVIGAFIGFTVLSFLSPAAFEHFFWATKSGLLIPVPGAPAGLSAGAYILLAVLGGIGVGVTGVLLGGCPLRQVTMTSEGNVKSLSFVVGMGIGAVVYTAYVSAWVVSLLKGII